MKRRSASATTFMSIATLGAALSLGGCASMSSTRPADSMDMVDTRNLPHITLPGARRTDVKLLAMGAARSKGWTIGESTPERFVAERPIERDSLLRLPGPEHGAAATPAPGSKMIVTSYFAEQDGGVVVATRAELFAKTAKPSHAPARIDYTEAFSDSLNQSLAALRSHWTTNSGLIARASPPHQGWGDKVIEHPDDSTQRAGTSTPPVSATTTVASTGSRPAPTNATTATTSTSSTPPASARASTPAQLATARRPAPEPRRLQNAAAPVVDASTRLSTNPTPKADMLVLPAERAALANSTALAEQYARAQGCQITGGGARLIESRSDGDLQKISCADRDNLYVRCQNGRCTGVF